mgnify:CR=1 FL=1
MDAIDTKLIRIDAVLALVPISRPTIYRLIKKGEFPKPLEIGSSRAWVAAEIEQWKRDRMAARDDQ